LVFESPSDLYANFQSVVEASLKRSNDKASHNNKYHLYTFNNQFTNIYAPYLLDLKKHLSKEYIEMFNSKVVNETCTYKNKEEYEVVGLPKYISYDLLYSNKMILDKYNKPVPKTWDELIDTCEYIMEKEKNNTELICYNGFFDESEQGLYSLYEFIYTCRDYINSTYPNPHDPTFANSLNLLKKLKEKVASDDIFKSNEYFTITKLKDGNFIFLKYWFMGNPIYDNVRVIYNMSKLPGIKEGISGTLISGDNIGIIRNITDDKIEAAIEVLKYYISKESQREMFGGRLGFSAIDELLNEEELCGDELCDTIKGIQFTTEPKFIEDGPVDYRKKYQKYIYQYIYNNNIKIDKTLKHIYDITKVYTITLRTDDSYVGLFFFVFSSVFSILMLLSIIFLFRDNFHPFFMFLPDDFWVITIIGSIILLWVPYINYGEVETIKCHLRPLYLAIGYTLSVCPILYRLIALFPEEYKITRLVFKHRYLFLIFIIIIDMLFCSISLINPYTPQFVSVENGESFKKCIFNGSYSIIILIAFKLLVILLMLFLVFVEWNISTSIYDMKFILIFLYSDILFIILICIFHISYIKNYIGYFILQSITTYGISLTNYIFIYGFRVFLGFIRKKDIKNHFINNVNEKFINNETSIQIQKSSTNYAASKSKYEDEVQYENDNSKNDTEESVSVNKTNFLTRMIDYHYTSYNSGELPMTNTTSVTFANINSLN